ncbi:MAG TPA: fructosamine kinase family protein [Thermoanaerobaculia bacterium]|jgi:fructosamine-3-kinase
MSAETGTLEAILGRALGEKVRVADVRAAGGGSINQGRVAQLADGRRFFVKTNPSPPPRMFECEAEGLRALAAAGALRVPRVIAVGGENEGAPALVLEAIDAGRPGEGFFARFGRAFAELHRATRGERFGFARDNYIGSTTQANRWTEDWCEFWRRHRLGFQLDLARRRGLSDSTLDRLGERLLDRLDELIGEPDEPPCLLHGDLWSGNYMVDVDGEPVLIDPAVYYGRREADLAMTRLFGGFTASFYDAYEELWPLAPGTQERQEVYKLYHLLNHLNLFGGGYRSSCIDVLRRFV